MFEGSTTTTTYILDLSVEMGGVWDHLSLRCSAIVNCLIIRDVLLRYDLFV